MVHSLCRAVENAPVLALSAWMHRFLFEGCCQRLPPELGLKTMSPLSRGCLINFLAAFGLDNLTFIADNVKAETMQWLPPRP